MFYFSDTAIKMFFCYMLKCSLSVEKGKCLSIVSYIQYMSLKLIMLAIEFKGKEVQLKQLSINQLVGQNYLDNRLIVLVIFYAQMPNILIDKPINRSM